MNKYQFNSVSQLAERILDHLFEKDENFGDFWETLGTSEQEEIEQKLSDSITENTEGVLQ